MTPDPIVSTAWLAARLGQSDISIIDGSWYLPAQKRDPEAEYLERHIPGAVRFDIDAIADTSRDLPHMLPDPATFARAAGDLGISDRHTIIVYDGAGLFSAARVWWSFRAMGVSKVHVLDGGFPAWFAEGRPVEKGPVVHTQKTFKARPEPDAVFDAASVRSLLDTGVQIVDMRPAARFSGEVAEPRPGLRKGHIPRSRNIPFTDLIRDGKLLPPDELRQKIAHAGVEDGSPLVTSCGSGVTAAVLNLALARIGIDQLSLYDGSWAEWGAQDDLPIETGS